MSRSVAFLRGINVGGHRVTKDELISVFVDLGYADVDTFLASGNVLFGPGPPVDEHAMAAALHARLGYEVPTTVRIRPELEALAADSPFSNAAIKAAAGKPQVILLFKKLSKAVISSVETASNDADLLIPTAKAVHWLPSAGVSGTALQPARLKNLLGPNTIRTTTTIQRLIPKL